VRRSRVLHAKFPVTSPVQLHSAVARVTSLTALGLASFAVAAPLAFPFKESVEQSTNKDTHHNFPVTLRNNSESLTLLNSAVRTVTMFQFYTYTLGLYLPDTWLRALRSEYGTALSAEQAATALSQLGAGQSTQLPGATVLALLRIIPYRRASPPHLLGSLARATCQRVKEFHGTDESRDWCAQLAASLPGVKDVEPGHVIDIELRADGTARVYFEQQLTAELARDSHAVTALLQLFAGPKSRTAAVHQALVEGLRQVVAK
jgi:hypothetical protein